MLYTKGHRHSPQQQGLQKRAAVLRYTYIVSCVEFQKANKTETRNVCSWNVNLFIQWADFSWSVVATIIVIKF